MERRLDELHGRLQQQRDAEAARADAGDGQPAARITYVRPAGTERTGFGTKSQSGEEETEKAARVLTR